MDMKCTWFVVGDELAAMILKTIEIRYPDNSKVK